MTRTFKVTVNGREYDVGVLEIQPGTVPTSSSQPAAPVAAAQLSAADSPAPTAARPTATVAASGTGDEVAPMGGVVVQVDVKVGQSVAINDHLLVMEAMKMKTHLFASRAGQVTRVLVAAGDPVEGGQALVTIQ